jgi:hypothetical protein
MIFYRPTEGDVEDKPIVLTPRTCFLMTKLGKPISEDILKIRKSITSVLSKYEFGCIDANSLMTGKDFLLKIWRLAMGVPLGVAIIDSSMKSQTMANIFYEVGWMQSQGKETLIIKTIDAKIPSDFVRTEYINFDTDFINRFNAFLTSIDEAAVYYGFLGDQLENNPLLSIDYYRRAFLITGSEEYQSKAKEVFERSDFKGRAKNSVESLHCGFATGNQIIKKICSN